MKYLKKYEGYEFIHNKHKEYERGAEIEQIIKDCCIDLIQDGIGVSG